MIYQNKEHNPTATLGDFIWVKNGSLSSDFCEDVINKFDDDVDNHEDGKVGTGDVVKNIKQTKDAYISRLDNWKDEDSVFFESLRRNTQEYMDFCASIDPCLRISKDYDFKDTGYQVQRYEPGGFYEWHNDWTMDSEFGSRVYTYIWYLNTLTPEEEGYTQFIDGTKMQPECGKLVIFPALWTYLHRAFPPKVRKYICTGWIYAKL